MLPHALRLQSDTGVAVYGSDGGGDSDRYYGLDWMDRLLFVHRKL